MKTPNFLSRRLMAAAAAAVLAATALAIPQTSSARDWDGHPGRGHAYGHDLSRHNYRHGRPVFYTRTRSLDASVQRALAMRGYYHGRADGDIGPGTRRAIVRYQLEHRMRPTGLIDRDLLRSLRLD